MQGVESAPVDESTAACEKVRLIFETLPQLFNVAASKGLHMVYRFKLDPLDYTIEVCDGNLTISPTTESSQPPHLTVSMSCVDYVGLLAGSITPADLYRNGKMSYQGDLNILPLLSNTLFEE